LGVILGAGALVIAVAAALFGLWRGGEAPVPPAGMQITR
jgi:hypothetical protein